MTPTLADSFGMTFYFLFSGAILWMIDWTLSHVFYIVPFSWILIIICAAPLAYIMTWCAKVGMPPP